MRDTRRVRRCLPVNCRWRAGTHRSAIPPSPTASSTGSSTTRTGSNCGASRCERSVAGRPVERAHEVAPPRFLQCRAGQGGSNAAPSPRTPLPGSTTKRLTDADHFCMIRTAQRRFAPTAIGITRNSDRHQFGISDRLRRNPHVAGQAELAYSTKPLQERRINQDNFARLQPDRSPDWIMDNFGAWPMGWPPQTFSILLKLWPKDNLELCAHS